MTKNAKNELNDKLASTESTHLQYTRSPCLCQRYSITKDYHSK